MKNKKELIPLAYKMAKSGISNKQIIEALCISKSAFYADVDIMDTIKKGKSELREEVSNALLEKATSGDTTALIFLSKRLNLFSDQPQLDLTSVDNALKSYSTLADADISLEHKNSLRGILSDYFKAYEITELEERLAALEEGIK